MVPSRWDRVAALRPKRRCCRFNCAPMEYPTLPQRLLDAFDAFNSPRAQIYKLRGQWQSVPAQEMLRRIARLSSSLSELGLRDGDRIAIFAPNCPEWHIVDFAASALGGVIVPIYFRESPERIEYIVNHAAARFVFVAGAEQIARFAAMRSRLPVVERVIVAQIGPELAASPEPHFVPAGAAATYASPNIQAQGSPTGGTPQDARATPADNVTKAVGASPAVSPAEDSFIENSLSYGTLIAQASDGDIALYRRRVVDLGFESCRLQSVGRQSHGIDHLHSGTTGEPKGVMLSHANMVSNEMGSFEGFPCGPADVALSFLPLAHVYERVTDYGYLFRGVSLAYVARPEDVSQALLEVRPTIVAAVPRFFEKLYATVIERGSQTTGARRRLFDWAIGVARQSVPWRAYGQAASPLV